MTANKVLIIGITLIVTIALVFIPTAIAYARRHPDRARLARLNVLALASFLLWAGLLVWAITGRPGGRVQRLMDDPRNQRAIRLGVAGLVAAGLATTAYALSRS